MNKPQLSDSLAKRLSQNGTRDSNSIDSLGEMPSVSAIDMRAISKFAQTDQSGEEFIAVIIEVFLADMSERVRAAGLQMGHHDSSGLAATAHALRGSCGHFGAARLMQLCGAIEDQVRSKQTDGIRAALDSMIAETERVREALKAFRYNHTAL